MSPSPTRLRRVLIGLGVAGLVASLAVGVGGWILAGSLNTTLLEALVPTSRAVEDISEVVEATRVMVSNTREAIENIENATRSSTRTLESVSELLGEVGQVASGDVADGLESSIQALPALIETGRLIDRSLRALRLVGIDYDPEVPMDAALTDLEASLTPVPDQIRDQAVNLDEVRSDMGDISADAGALSASLLQVRIDMLDAERVLREAAADAKETAIAANGLQSDINGYGTLTRWLAAAASIALATAALAPLIVGLSMSGDVERRTASPVNVRSGPSATATVGTTGQSQSRR